MVCLFGWPPMAVVRSRRVGLVAGEVLLAAIKHQPGNGFFRTVAHFLLFAANALTL